MDRVSPRLRVSANDVSQTYYNVFPFLLMITFMISHCFCKRPAPLSSGRCVSVCVCVSVKITLIVSCYPFQG